MKFNRKLKRRSTGPVIEVNELRQFLDDAFDVPLNTPVFWMLEDIRCFLRGDEVDRTGGAEPDTIGRHNG